MNMDYKKTQVEHSFHLFDLVNSIRESNGDKPYRNHADMLIKLERYLPSFSKEDSRKISIPRINNLGKEVKDVAYRLTEDEVVSVISKETFCDNYKRIYAKKEHGALCAIEQLKGVTLKRNYLVKTDCGRRYFIDGYDSVNNIAYEIDESHHQYTRAFDHGRAELIKDCIGCEFIRIAV
ncbi:hypothetical protein NVP1161O_044 [Vibrio phage 1.161.O._10N.261.48.C5]|nr:hypothetical protein NVP1161O_044 [Vibrio phage 1.161.O._10N.261.48.C5]